MRSWRVRELGAPREVLKLEEVEDPSPGPGEVVVEGLAECAHASPPGHGRARAPGPLIDLRIDPGRLEIAMP